MASDGNKWYPNGIQMVSKWYQNGFKCQPQPPTNSPPTNSLTFRQRGQFPVTNFAVIVLPRLSLVPGCREGETAHQEHQKKR